MHRGDQDADANDEQNQYAVRLVYETVVTAVDEDHAIELAKVELTEQGQAECDLVELIG